MVVQVAAVRALLDVAVLGEVLHPDPDVHHRLATVFAVEAGLGDTQGTKKINQSIKKHEAFVQFENLFHQLTTHIHVLSSHTPV